MDEKRRGTRCKVCVGCGRCFSDEEAGAAGAGESGGAGAEKAWSGRRCEVCVGCGKCLREWGLFGADAESGATNWADAFKLMDAGTGPEPPAVPAPPGSPASSGNAAAAEVPELAADSARSDAVSSASVTTEASPAEAPSASRGNGTGAASAKRSPFATLKSGGDGIDVSTGATPGVSAALKEFGMADSASYAASLGLKPPGQI